MPHIRVSYCNSQYKLTGMCHHMTCCCRQYKCVWFSAYLSASLWQYGRITCFLLLQTVQICRNVSPIQVPYCYSQYTLVEMCHISKCLTSTASISWQECATYPNVLLLQPVYVGRNVPHIQVSYLLSQYKLAGMCHRPDLLLQAV